MYAACVSLVLLGFTITDLTRLNLWPLLYILPLGGLAAMCFSSFALLFTARVPTIDHMNYPVFLVGIPLSLVSNTYFPVDRIHPTAALIAQANPIYHLSRVVRHLLLGGSPEIWMFWSAGFIAAAGVVLAFIAHKWMDRRLEKES